MTPEQHTLIQRILQHWDLPPTAERVRAWSDLLDDCDLGLAGTVFAQSRGLKNMTPAVFAHEYKQRRPKRGPELYTPNWSGREISFAQHWELLNRAGAQGDTIALNEIAQWRTHANNGRLPARWAEVIHAHC